MIIYALIDPRNSEVRYIGKSHRSAVSRLQRHLSPSNLKGNTHKERWIREVLKARMEPTIRIIQACETADELNRAERFHIANLRAAGARLTNTREGGDGEGSRHTPESIEKIRTALTGKRKTAAHKIKTGLASRGRRLSQEVRARLSEFQSTRLRKPHARTHCINMSRGRGATAFVDQFGVTYQTQHEAARTLGLCVSHINKVLHGKRAATKGYEFRFVGSSEGRA